MSEEACGDAQFFVEEAWLVETDRRDTLRDDGLQLTISVICEQRVCQQLWRTRERVRSRASFGSSAFPSQKHALSESRTRKHFHSRRSGLFRVMLASVRCTRRALPVLAALLPPSR